ncbi:MAG: capsule assembly Wzi family protein [Muribaculaceae bacterium]
MAMPMNVAAQCAIDYEAKITVNIGDGELAPHYIMSNRYGTVTQCKSTLASVEVSHPMDTTKRFSYGFGAELWGGWASDAEYQRYSSGQWSGNNQHPSRVWLQQLYGELKYRGGVIAVGVQQHRNQLVDADLGSGDLVLSGNARPMPGVRIGFIDYQNVPLTNGWVQVGGELAYYKDMQDSWLENHYNYYSSGITRDSYSNYQRCYFRTKPQARLSVTVGMQSAAQFLGERTTYSRGFVQKVDKSHNTVEAFFKAFWPGAGKSESSIPADVAYYEGNHVGSWDLAVRYSLRDGSTIRGYFQKPFEDGSGIGMMNGFDGVYGIEYHPAENGWINGAVVEYFDFTNQSGPMHWAPGDSPDSPIKGQATGSDNYYNNYFYNGYASRGMSIGTSVLPAPIYNSDGKMFYKHNLVRGFHAAIMGNVTSRLRYRAMVMYRKSWGSQSLLMLNPLHSTSAMVEGEYRFCGALPLTVKAQVAVDRGKLVGNNVGCLVSVVYRGSINKISGK